MLTPAAEEVVRAEEISRPVKRAMSGKGQRVWIDLENSPHVPFFKPIIRELEKRGYTVILTARDCFQVCELADASQLKYKRVGRHYGKNTLAKMTGLAIRSMQLMPGILRQKPDIAVSHGSRSLFLLSSVLRVPTITIMDYEHVKWAGFANQSWVMAPEIIPEEAFVAAGVEKEHVLRYPGIKEDVYTPLFQPNPSFKSTLGLGENEIIVTIRPPATEAHYHNPESEKLLAEVMTTLDRQPNTRAVIVPRTPKQGKELQAEWPGLFENGKAMIPEHAVDGLDLIWHSDLVISGGGTMNREAASLGVPVYSIFRGKLGSVDKYLAEKGRLVLLESVDDVRNKLKIVRRPRAGSAAVKSDALRKVVDNIVEVLGRTG